MNTNVLLKEFEPLNGCIFASYSIPPLLGLNNPQQVQVQPPQEISQIAGGRLRVCCDMTI